MKSLITCHYGCVDDDLVGDSGGEKGIPQILLLLLTLLQLRWCCEKDGLRNGLSQYDTEDILRLFGLGLWGEKGAEGVLGTDRLERDCLRWKVRGDGGTANLCCALWTTSWPKGSRLLSLVPAASVVEVVAFGAILGVLWLKAMFEMMRKNREKLNVPVSTNRFFDFSSENFLYHSNSQDSVQSFLHLCHAKITINVVFLRAMHLNDYLLSANLFAVTTRRRSLGSK